MKTEYKHLYFIKQPQLKSRKTETWSITNIHTAEEIGEIKWYAPWRQYCSFISTMNVYNEMVFSSGCHIDVADFIKQLMDARKK